jgi:hypothetical protein
VIEPTTRRGDKLEEIPFAFSLVTSREPAERDQQASVPEGPVPLNAPNVPCGSCDPAATSHVEPHGEPKMTLCGWLRTPPRNRFGCVSDVQVGF